MGLYEGIKDVAKVVQKADNIQLYSQLIELSAQALELQDEISALKLEIRELKKNNEISDRIQRHEQPFITLKDESLSICYCSRCWDVDSRLVQVYCDTDRGTFSCPNCRNSGVYDQQTNDEKIARDRASFERSVKSGKVLW